MAENLATQLQIQTLNDITRKLVKDAPESPHVNGYKSERHYAYHTDVPMGQAVVDGMHMTSYIAEAADTSWDVQIGVSNQEASVQVGDLKFTTMYLLRCRANRPSGLRVSRLNWLYLHAATDGQYTLVHEQEAADVDFTDAGLKEFGAVYSTGYNSEVTRSYIDKIIETDPEHAATIAGFISQACGVPEQGDIAPELPKEPFIVHRHPEIVSNSFCADFSTFIGGLTLLNQVNRLPR